MRVAINGFGRIGRLILRAGLNDPDIEFVAVNDLTDPFTLAHMLKYDSVHGRLNADINAAENSLMINGKEIKVFAEKQPEKLPWQDLDIDVVVESTGLFRTKELASKHLQAGAKKVLISAPAKGDDVKTIVKGVNEHTYDKDKHHVVSNASCTTNCLAPIAKVLHDNFGIERGFMVTVHAYTASQKIVDAPHKDLRRGRAAAVNIVPTTTGAAKTVERVIPELKDCLDGMAMRVPVADGSIVDFAVDLKKHTNKEELDNLFRAVSQNELKGVIEFSDGHLVSSDVIGNPHSAIYDSAFTRVIQNDFVDIIAWYDNEWGYSSRMIDVLKILL